MNEHEKKNQNCQGDQSTGKAAGAEVSKKSGRRRRRGQKPNDKQSNAQNNLEQDVAGSNNSALVRPHVVTGSTAPNDASWYTHIYPLVGDVADLSFPQVLGLPENSVGNTTPGNNILLNPMLYTKITPGLMVIEYYPSFGISSDPLSPMNLGSQQLYTLVRKANSGRVNYDRTDLMMVPLAMDSAYMLYEDMLRAYRLICNYKARNRYMPNGLLRAMGYGESLEMYLKDFAGLLDVFAYKLGSVNVPNQFDYIKRHSWMNSNVYKDSQDPRAQMYMYKQVGWYQWTEGTEGKPTGLHFVTREQLFGLTTSNPVVTTIDQMYNAMNTLMSPILGSQDIGWINGDIEKAFGDAGMITIQPASSYETLEPVYNEEVILQMMNTVTPGTVPPSGLDLTIEYNDLVHGPYFMYTPQATISTPQKLAMIQGCNKLLNYHMMNPTPELNLVATRMMCSVEAETDNTSYAITSCGSEIPVGIRMYFLDVDSDTLVAPVEFNQWMYYTVDGSGIPESTTVIGYLNQLNAQYKFDNCPTAYMAYATGGATTRLTLSGIFQDFDNYRWLTNAEIEQLNNVAMLSLFSATSYNDQLRG